MSARALSYSGPSHEISAHLSSSRSSLCRVKLPPHNPAPDPAHDPAQPFCTPPKHVPLECLINLSRPLVQLVQSPNHPERRHLSITRPLVNRRWRRRGREDLRERRSQYAIRRRRRREGWWRRERSASVDCPDDGVASSDGFAGGECLGLGGNDHVDEAGAERADLGAHGEDQDREDHEREVGSGEEGRFAARVGEGLRRGGADEKVEVRGVQGRKGMGKGAERRGGRWVS